MLGCERQYQQKVYLVMKFLVSIGYFRVELMRQLQVRLEPSNRP